MFKVLDDFPGFIINKTALAMKNEFEKNLKSLGITAVQFSIMKRLWECDGLNQKEIAQRTYKKTAEITHLIDKLEQKAFVERSSSESDRREYKIKLTPLGKSIESKAMEASRVYMEKVLCGVDKNELKIALSVCEKIFANAYETD